MQIDFFGANCLRLKTNNTVLVFDDNLKALGARSIISRGDVVCLTNDKLIQLTEIPATKIIIDTPGNYEVSDVLIDGIWAKSFMLDLEPAHATIYKVVSENINLAIVGHIQPDLSEEQLEELGIIDILFVPVGGAGYTLDALGAFKVVKSIDPKLVIPTHFEQKGLRYEVPQATFEEFAKLIPAEAEYIAGTLRLKKADLGEQLALKILQPL